jgi:hypothetical protein
MGESLSVRLSTFFFHFSFIIHMCIQGVVHFSPRPPPPPLPPKTEHSYATHLIPDTNRFYHLPP